MGLYRFELDDIIYNVVKTYPTVEFFIDDEGKRYFNNMGQISGAFTNSVGAKVGSKSLYELNVDRSKKGATGTRITKRIEPFTLKGENDGVTFKIHSTGAYMRADPGTKLTSSYPLTASITKYYYPEYGEDPNDSEIRKISLKLERRKYLFSLKNTINNYIRLSPHFEFSSSIFRKSVHDRDLATCLAGLIDIPSIFYGSSIKKGSVNLKFYISGTLRGELKDEKRDGRLIQILPEGAGSGSTAGLVLYNEGFLILTGTHTLQSSHAEAYFAAGSDANPTWTSFAQSISGTISTPSSSYSLSFKGTNPIPTITMFAHANKGFLNHSNNPTYIKNNQNLDPVTGSNVYIEQEELEIKNVVSAAYSDPTGSFDKTTYISKIGIYDKFRNLIGIAKMATPIKKTADRDLTFKLKLDV